MSYGRPPVVRERRNIRYFFADNTAAKLAAIMLQVDAMRADNGQQAAQRAAPQTGKSLQIRQLETET